MRGDDGGELPGRVPLRAGNGDGGKGVGILPHVGGIEEDTRICTLRY